jgi:hypothetical protein
MSDIQPARQSVPPVVAVSVLMLILGTIGLTIGLAIALGWIWALLTPSILMLVVGFALGFRT